MESFNADGFVPLFRQMMKWDLWKKPLHYFKIFMFFYMRANYQENGHLKRGQLETSRQELKKICSAGFGKSRSEITSQQVHHALEYFKNNCRQCPITVKDGLGDELCITLLNYDALSVGDVSGMCGESVGDAPGTNGGCTGDVRGISSYKYNNKKNNNKKNNNKKERNGYCGNAKPSRFNNFTPRATDYDAILKKKAEARNAREEIE